MLTNNGIEWICQNLGNNDLCCVESGLTWQWTDIDGYTGTESGGTAQALSRLILPQLITKITMLTPARGDKYYSQLRSANGGNDVTMNDVDTVMLHDGGSGEDQWCYSPPIQCEDITNYTECINNDCYWYNGSCHSSIICSNILNENECLLSNCYWYDGACHSEPQSECSPDGIRQCQGYDLYECQNGYWTLIERNSTTCGYVPPEEPNYLLYAGIGLLAVGVLAIILKGRKKEGEP